MMRDSNALKNWVALLSKSELPVLKQTARDLIALKADDKRLNAHTVAQVIAHDPIMTVKLLRYLQRNKRDTQTTEVIQIEQALLMLGLEPFFNKVAPQPTVEELLKSHIVALPPLLRVVHRSHRASEYAMDWAVQLHDMHFEEVRIAALLHDIAEILLWCFAPAEMLQIREMQQKDRTLRSRAAQDQVLGFAIVELQKALAEEWQLPSLLLDLMDDSHAHQSRVKSVVLAVNLARHSANGWDDAALPDDYKDIGDLLRISALDVMSMVAADAEQACDIAKPH